MPAIGKIKRMDVNIMESQHRIKVVQQVLAPQSKGGVSSEFRALEQSKLCERYQFIPLILSEGHRGINLYDILFYYRGIKKENPDIVHIRGAGVDGLNAEIAAKLFGNAKVLVSVHGMYSDFVYYNPIKKWIARHIIEPLCFKLADGISCVYQRCETRNNFQKYKKKIIPFVYNRIPNYLPEKYVNMREVIRNQYAIRNGDVVGVFCGRVSKEKGLSFLVKALISVQDEINEGTHFFIVGEGNYLEEFQKTVEIYPNLSRIVHFLGIKDDVQPILAASDYFLLPSLHENHSIALLEAMAMELPAIVTDVGGNKETVKDGKFGIIIPPYDVSALAKAIIQMGDSERRNAFKEEIKAYSFSEFGNEAVDAQLDAAYQEIMYRM